MAPQALPFDILLLVLEISPRSTAARMTRTCRTLRDGGARFLFDGGVSLTSGDNIASFVQFLYADAPNRFQYFRSLELACGTMPPQAVDVFLGLLSHPLLALDSLELREAESVLTSIPASISSSDIVHGASRTPLFPAIARLTTVIHLAVRGHCGPYACGLIRTIRSALKTACVEFVPLYSGALRLDDIQRRNPILALSNHSATLEEVSGLHFAMLPARDPFGIVLPSVHTINATFSPVLPPQTLIVAFPNLIRLSLIPALYRPGPASGSHMPSRLRQAMKRRLRQRELQESHVPRQAWTKLEELEGCLIDLVALGLLPCHVPMVRLTGTLCEPPEYEHLKVVLEDTRPARLAVSVAVVDASTFSDTMGSVFSDPSAQQLRDLEIELVFSASEGDVDIGAVLSDVATTLAVLSLHRVTLVLNHALLIAPEESDRPRQEWSRPVKRDVAGFDVAATRTLLRAAIPSLVVDVVVRFSTDRTSGTSSRSMSITNHNQ